MQTVGAKGYDCFTIALVTEKPDERTAGLLPGMAASPARFTIMAR